MDCFMRPGGLEITKKAFDICAPRSPAKVLDIGCGRGDTAAYLTRERGFDVIGMDISAKAVASAKEKYPELEFLEGDGEALDFPSRTFDCVLMECSLSLIPNPIEAVHEAFCVLKESGALIIHDLYIPRPSREDMDTIRQTKESKTKKHEGACSEKREPEHTINGALILNDIYAELAELGLEIILFEDRGPDLADFAASLIFEGADLENYCRVDKDGPKPSYFLLIAKKRPV